MARFFACTSLVAVCLCLSSVSFAAERGPVAPSARNERVVPAAALRAAAESFELAMRYEHGDGVNRNFDRAVALYCDAARHGEAKAFFNLGWMFLNGRGVARNDAIAVSWLKKAADRGSEQAANLLRLMPHTNAATSDGCPMVAFAGPARPIVAPDNIRNLVAGTAQELGVDPQLIMAVIAVESAFNPRAVSPKNAQGLMQLMPDTALRFGVRDPFDEKENVRGGTTYLRELLKRFDGDLVLALAAYNAGEGAILINGGVPPYQETKNYIERVTRLCGCTGSEG